MASMNVTNFPRVLSGSVVSVVERPEDTKVRFVFELNLDWADGTSTIIFRGYQEFFEFHCELLDSFPQDAGSIKGCNRTIPYLPGKQLFRRSTKSLALQRLPKLNDYLNDIIKLPERIVTSNTVLGFLINNWIQEKVKYIATDKSGRSNNDSELVNSMEAVLHVDDGIRVRFINNDQKNHTTLVSSSDMTDEVYFNEEREEEEEEDDIITENLTNGRRESTDDKDDTPDTDILQDEDTLIEHVPI